MIHPAPPIINLEKVQLRLGTVDFALNLQVLPGKITAITGVSGSGKSTLLNLIAGFERPETGRVLINNTDVSGHTPAQRPVSLVFQDHNLFAHLDIATNIGLGIHPSLRLSLADRQAIGDALQRVGLAGYEKRLPATLSGGEKQRVAFARALVRRKPILLLDEPFAALDPGLRASMADLLKALHRETANSVLIVTHHLSDVERLADDVIFMDRGNIILHCDQAAFFRDNHTEALKKFRQS